MPAATLMRTGKDGPEPVPLGPKLKDRKVIIVGLPGAFTGTCSSAHVPSFIRTKPQFDALGIDEIIIFSVNDPQVVRAWGFESGATAAGLTLLADPESKLTMALGMRFDAPEAGLVGRCARHVIYAENGVVKILNVEASRGICELTAGESLLEQLT